MRKITLLLSFIACVLVAQAQNLLTNPSFETWTNGTAPDSWTLTTTVAGTVSKVATTIPTKTGFGLQVAGPTGTYTIQQNVVPPTGANTFSTSTVYQLSVSYLVTAGDGTDARVWSGLVTSAVGAGTTTYYAIATTHSDSLLYYIPLHGPGGNINPPTGIVGNDLNGYLLDNRTSGVWHTYTCDVNFPAGITQFNFAVRQYSNSTVIWDDFKFGIKGTLSALPTISAENLNILVIGKKITLANTLASSVDIFNTLGSKVQTVKLVGGSAELNLPKGLYIARVGNQSAKIFLKD